MADNSKAGFCNTMNGDDLRRLVVGYTQTEVVNSSSGDVIPTMTNCRAISVDVDGIMKIDYLDDFGEVRTTEVFTMKAGVIYPCRNVVKVYRYYTGTSAVAQVYISAGTLVNGLKLRR